MKEVPIKVSRRRQKRYNVFRSCWLIADGTTTAVMLLSVSAEGIATLGPKLPLQVRGQVEFVIEGISTALTATVINVSYGRVGARFDLASDVASLWLGEFAEMIAGIEPLD